MFKRSVLLLVVFLSLAAYLPYSTDTANAQFEECFRVYKDTFAIYNHETGLHFLSPSVGIQSYGPPVAMGIFLNTTVSPSRFEFALLDPNTGNVSTSISLYFEEWQLNSPIFMSVPVTAMVGTDTATGVTDFVINNCYSILRTNTLHALNSNGDRLSIYPFIDCYEAQLFMLPEGPPTPIYYDDIIVRE